MQHRDRICLQKIIKEIDIGKEMLGTDSLVYSDVVGNLEKLA